MKLYATTASERAEKGQGGNKWLTVEFTCGDAKHPQRMGYIKLDNMGDERYVLRYTSEHDQIPHVIDEWKLEKGNQQKGDKDYCTAGHKDYTENCPACADNIPF